VFSPAETSEHHTLGGKELWGKKKRREYMHDRYDKLSESDKDAGFLSAPWKFMRFGSGTRGDTDGADTSSTKWLPVNTVLCKWANEELKDLAWNVSAHKLTCLMFMVPGSRVESRHTTCGYLTSKCEVWITGRRVRNAAASEPC
jgi:hypothetical protein